MLPPVAATRAGKLSTPLACMVSISMAQALPEKGLTSAVGSASTKRVSQPAFHQPANAVERVAQRT